MHFYREDLDNVTSVPLPQIDKTGGSRKFNHYSTYCLEVYSPFTPALRTCYHQFVKSNIKANIFLIKKTYIPW